MREVLSRNVQALRFRINATIVIPPVMLAASISAASYWCRPRSRGSLHDLLTIICQDCIGRVTLKVRVYRELS
jgi:hypothetical protein